VRRIGRKRGKDGYVGIGELEVPVGRDFRVWEGKDEGRRDRLDGRRRGFDDLLSERRRREENRQRSSSFRLGYARICEHGLLTASSSSQAATLFVADSCCLVIGLVDVDPRSPSTRP
jgi:hypothetical protein